jgi:citrate synthase
LGRKERIMGFGHRVYKTLDPRAIHLKEMSRQLAKKTGNFQFFNISQKLEEIVTPLLKEKRIYPNVDFYSGTVYNNLGIPEELFNSIFAVSRTAGWAAHILEQLGDNRLIRPREKYTGGMDLEYIPIRKRK